MKYAHKTGLPEDWEKQFPNSSQNNSRAYIRRLIKYFEDCPSDSLANLLESLIEGITIDHSDGDWGTGERGEY